MPTSRYERAARRAGYQVIAGLDEAGRGALFGPVFAAAVVLDPDRPIRGLDDSKQLAPERRDVLATRIRGRAFAWAVAAADAFEIDRVNILEAARLAMQRAVSRLNEQLRAKELGDKPLRNSKPETDAPGGEVCQCDYLLVDAGLTAMGLVVPFKVGVPASVIVMVWLPAVVPWSTVSPVIPWTILVAE